MSQITISMPDNLEREIRKEVKNGGYATVSAYITEVMRKSLMNEERLDYWYRVGLTLQLQNNKLLSTLVKDKELIKDSDWPYSRTLEVLEDGIVSEYDGIFNNVDKEGMTRGNARFVIDVLAMYEDLKMSAKQLALEGLEDSLSFPGFDGNNDPDLLGYVRHLVKHQRFAHVKPRDLSYNSHGLHPHYSGMLSRYTAIRDKQDLTMEWLPLSEKEIHDILGK